MIFTPEHVRLIAEGRKTQTRRVSRSGEWHAVGVPDAVITPTGRIKWRVGGTYAVQPGRGKPGAWALFDHPCHSIDVWMDMAQKAAVVDGDGEKMVDAAQIARGQGYEPLRIYITDIRRQWLQDISEDDVIAEGHALIRWAGEGPEGWPATAGYAEVWDRINRKPGTRWADNPPVWALTFEVVQ